MIPGESSWEPVSLLVRYLIPGFSPWANFPETSERRKEKKRVEGGSPGHLDNQQVLEPDMGL